VTAPGALSARFESELREHGLADRPDDVEVLVQEMTEFTSGRALRRERDTPLVLEPNRGSIWTEADDGIRTRHGLAIDVRSLTSTQEEKLAGGRALIVPLNDVLPGGRALARN
jgi:hypothetical protein